MDDLDSKLEPMVEGIDYYFDDLGFMVMTQAYHLKRGYCCDSGCRHCPYDKDKKAK